VGEVMSEEERKRAREEAQKTAVLELEEELHQPAKWKGSACPKCGSNLVWQGIDSQWRTIYRCLQCGVEVKKP